MIGLCRKLHCPNSPYPFTPLSLYPYSPNRIASHARIRYHLFMPIGSNIQAWRISRGQSITALATKAGLTADSLEAIETGQLDMSLSTMEAVAAALGVPSSWLHGDPKQLELLTVQPDGDESDPPSPGSIDPVIERILLAVHHDRELYGLLTRLLQAGDPKLIRAAEVSLRSLVKQAKQATVPWESRPPGHFEPPSD